MNVTNDKIKGKREKRQIFTLKNYLFGCFFIQ